MTLVRRWAPGAGPADVLFMAYVAFTGLVLLLFGWQLGTGVWLGLTLAHAALLLVARWWSAQPVRGPSWGGFFRDAYPLLFIAFLYWELRYLAQLFAPDFNDPVILALEELLFGEQLAVTFSQRLPSLLLSEILHFFYALYWLFLPLAGGALYLRGRLEGWRELVFVELVVFFTCYFFFIFFPVQGPFYQFEPIGEPWSNGFFYKLVHWVLEDGGSQGAAFPSSHVAVACVILPVAWRCDRAVFWWFLPAVVGLTLGTVYGRFHYAVDALGGVVVAAVLFPVALRMRRVMGRA